MEQTYEIQIVDKETMTEIESAQNLSDAVQMVKEFEAHDIETNIYEPDFYRILRKWKVGNRSYCAEFTGRGLLIDIKMVRKWSKRI